MITLKTRRSVVACSALVAGLLMNGGCKTESYDSLEGEKVEVPLIDYSKPFVARDVRVAPTTAYDTKNSETAKSLAGWIGGQLQGRLASRGHRIVSSGGAAIEVRVSVEEIRPYQGFDWRAYIAKADVQVPALGNTANKKPFSVDGRTLGPKKYFVYESAALQPVQDELLKQIDEWIATVLKSMSDDVNQTTNR